MWFQKQTYAHNPCQESLSQALLNNSCLFNARRGNLGTRPCQFLSPLLQQPEESLSGVMLLDTMKADEKFQNHLHLTTPRLETENCQTSMTDWSVPELHRPKLLDSTQLQSQYGNQVASQSMNFKHVRPQTEKYVEVHAGKGINTYRTISSSDLDSIAGPQMSLKLPLYLTTSQFKAEETILRKGNTS